MAGPQLLVHEIRSSVYGPDFERLLGVFVKEEFGDLPGLSRLEQT